MLNVLYSFFFLCDFFFPLLFKLKVFVFVCKLTAVWFLFSGICPVGLFFAVVFVWRIFNLCPSSLKPCATVKTAPLSGHSGLIKLYAHLSTSSGNLFNFSLTQMSPRKNGFGVNNMIASCSAWWWRGVGDIFLHTWYQLSIAAERAHPFLTTVLPALWHSHQISIQWRTFGMWWNRRFTSWICSQQICWNYVLM